jgi:hypothetical protein
MATPNHFLPISSTRKFFGLLTLALLLVNVAVVNPQGTTPANSNNSNANVSVNANANANLSNANANTSANANQNGNANGTTDQSEPTGTPTPRPGEEARKNTLVGSWWFPTIIIAMFGAVLLGFAYTITRAIRFSKETFRSKSGLPEGSLRAMLAFMLVAFLGFYVLASILSFTEFKAPDTLFGIVATVIGFYFGSRTGEDKNAAARTTGILQGNVTDNAGAAAGGADVELSQSDGKKVTQKADANGKYKFDNLAAGDYEIQASLTPHTPSDIAKVKMTAGATQTVNLTLK